MESLQTPHKSSSFLKRPHILKPGASEHSLDSTTENRAYRPRSGSSVCVAKLLQLCPTLCDPMDCSLPWASPGKNTRVGYHALLQGIFLTKGSNPQFLCLLYWQVGPLPPESLDPGYLLKCGSGPTCLSPSKFSASLILEGRLVGVRGSLPFWVIDPLEFSLKGGFCNSRNSQNPGVPP